MGIVKGILAFIRNDPTTTVVKNDHGGVAVLFLTSALFVLLTGLGTLKFTTDLLTQSQHREVLNEDMESLVTMISFALDQELACTANLIQGGGQGIGGRTMSPSAITQINQRLQYLAPATWDDDSVHWGSPLVDLRDQRDSTDSKRYFQRLEIIDLRLVRGEVLPKAPKPDYIPTPSDESAYLVHLRIAAAPPGRGDKATVVRDIPIYLVTDGTDRPVSCQATRYIDSNVHSRIIAGRASVKTAFQNSTLEDRACQIRMGVHSPAETRVFKFDPVYNRCLQMDIGSASGSWSLSARSK